MPWYEKPMSAALFVGLSRYPRLQVTVDTVQPRLMNKNNIWKKREDLVEL